MATVYPYGTTPSTNCYLCQIPMTGNGEDWQISTSSGGWLGYVKGRVKDMQTDFSYQRADKIIRYPANADDLFEMGINYVAWQNTHFNNKWFYAFVDEIEYRNENVTWLHIRLDVINMWIYDADWNGTFFERVLPTSDNLYEWLLPEGQYSVDSGVRSNIEALTTTQFGTTVEFMASSLASSYFAYVVKALSGNDDKVVLVDNLPDFAESWVCENVGEVTEVLSKFEWSNPMTNKQMIGGYVIPKLDGYADLKFSAQMLPPSGWSPIQGGDALPSVDGSSSYVPNNWKLYSYPYCAQEFYTGGGDSLQIAVERTDGKGGAVAVLYVNASCPCNPYVAMAGYNGNYGTAVDHELTLDLGRLPSFNIAYQDNAQALVDTVKQVGSGIATFALTGAMMAVAPEAALPLMTIGAAYQGFKYGTSLADASFPDYNYVSGRTNASVAAQISNSSYGLYTCNRSIPAEIAKAVDDYFSLYGYKVSQALDFNPINFGRTYFTYCKCAGYSYTSSSVTPPREHAQEFESRFNSGIRLWKSDAPFAQKNSAVLKANSLH